MEEVYENLNFPAHSKNLTKTFKLNSYTGFSVHKGKQKFYFSQLLAL